MHLRQPTCTCSVFEAFIKNKERLQHLKKQDIHDIFIKTS